MTDRRPTRLTGFLTPFSQRDLSPPDHPMVPGRHQVDFLDDWDETDQTSSGENETPDESASASSNPGQDCQDGEDEPEGAGRAPSSGVEQVTRDIVDDSIGAPPDWGVRCPVCDDAIGGWELIDGYTCDCGARLVLDVVFRQPEPHEQPDTTTDDEDPER